jgi:hypothetical protein
MANRYLTPEEEAEREQLTQAIQTALENRSAFLDRMMVKYSDLQVGDEIYNLKTGSCLGVVTELYRYWKSQNKPLLDVSYGCHYRYRNIVGDLDNTSRQDSLSVGTKEQAVQHAKFNLQRLGG